jgi:hypothetical protein
VGIALRRYQPVAPQLRAASQLEDRRSIDRPELEEHHLVGRYESARDERRVRATQLRETATHRLDISSRHAWPVALDEKSQHVPTVGPRPVSRQISHPDRGFAPIPPPGAESSKGDTYCSTGVDNGLPAIGTLESAANGTTNIGEDYYQEASIAVGTLCNRIFGSGNTTPDLSKLLAAAAVASASAAAAASAGEAAQSAFASTLAPAG